jgi:nitrogen fixation/metabolism regulation signal transduction histidine kinase
MKLIVFIAGILTVFTLSVLGLAMLAAQWHNTSILESVDENVGNDRILAAVQMDVSTIFQKAFLVFGISALLLSLGAALIISAILTRPLKNMSQAIHDISMGNLKGAIAPGSRIDEYETLAAALHRITKTMKLAMLAQQEKATTQEQDIHQHATSIRTRLFGKEKNREHTPE